ncbi:TetR/AcrR family transcriptional regulator [Streptomyces liangshanensis]|uniref:TetR/AcrR family transcriptional regulator n=1 Tax=Streptomyces liangshanensis TaxID=2717324 RepID=A0A6G9GX31_9ACTN|nr:TetR/AcrR family transcriptional regulator [Streptomyces liangshanensis]QIQ02770.1 TetR/AcrR family transcriptional regulator [Streptomyces liangshanensis]
MPTAREALLDAAQSALAEVPWQAVRMVEVASAAGVSRQTLYNEFSGKDGLARALVRREADLYLRGVEGQLAEADTRAEPADRLAAVAEWTVARAADRPLLRALLTGCWGEWLPTPRPSRTPGASAAVPAPRGAGTGPPVPAELVALVRDRSASTLDGGRTDHNLRRCELAVRLALSHLVAPGAQPVGQLVRSAVTEAAV